MFEIVPTHNCHIFVSFALEESILPDINLIETPPSLALSPSCLQSYIVTGSSYLLLPPFNSSIHLHVYRQYLITRLDTW